MLLLVAPLGLAQGQNRFARAGSEAEPENAVSGNPTGAAAYRLPPKHFTSKQHFHLPIRISEGSRSQLREVVLYLKKGNGPWVKQTTAEPTEKHFTYRAPADGEYWFSVTTVDTAGRSNPVDVTKEPPALIVVVDTQAPLVEVSPVTLQGGEKALRCFIKDANPKYETVTLAYLGMDGDWHQLPAMPSMPGTFALPTTPVKDNTFRYSAKDRADNPSSEIVYVALPKNNLAAGNGTKPDVPVIPPSLHEDQKPILTPSRYDGQDPTTRRQIRQTSNTSVTTKYRQQAQPQLSGGLPDPTQGNAMNRVGPGINQGTRKNPQVLGGHRPEDRPTQQIRRDGTEESHDKGIGNPKPFPAGHGRMENPNGAITQRNPAGVTPPTVTPRPLPHEVSNPPSYQGPFQPKSDSPQNPHRTEEPKTSFPPGGQTLTPSPVQNSRTSYRQPQDILNRQLINTRQATIDYRLDQVGPSGVSKVDVWVKSDQAGRWQLRATDMDRRSPVEVNLPGDGLYGIHMAVTNGHGLGGQAPHAKTVPDFWLEVDTTAPFARIENVAAGTRGATVEIDWTASDSNLGKKPISLFYSTTRGGPWLPIAQHIENEKHYTWRFPQNVGSQFYIRLEVRDEAGNVTRAEPPSPLTLDLTRPKALVVGVRGAAPVGGQ
ncbi:MAG: hypothetical protein ACFCD0_16995 [Gemmataceae bacterium]